MNAYAVPLVGASVALTFPEPYGNVEVPQIYRVVAVRPRQLVLWPHGQTGGAVPPPGVPCLVAPADGPGGSSCEAEVVSSGGSRLVVDIAPDPRQHPRYRRPCRVRLEVPGSGLGVVAAVLEDISAGGMRVHTTVLLPLDSRVFVSVLLAETQPILAIAQVRGVYRGAGPDSVVARLQFTMMPPTHAARLAALLEWPLIELEGDDLAPTEVVGRS